MFCQELAAQLARDVKPRLDEAECKTVPPVARVY